MTKQGKNSENSVASSVASLWRAAIITCYSQITHPSDVKEQVIWYLNVFTGVLAGTASSYPHIPTDTESNRLHRAVHSVGIRVLSLEKLSIFCKVISLACQVRAASQLHYLELLLSLLKNAKFMNLWFWTHGRYHFLLKGLLLWAQFVLSVLLLTSL